tara:strand:+ start:1030 stop:2163 length:1134 start_codon:yes stop_codon:yes gene_type:complete
VLFRLLYNLLLSLALPFLTVYWIFFHYKNNIPIRRVLERLGWVTDYPKNAVWIHAASIGELKLTEHLLPSISKKHPIVISTMTGRGFENKLEFPHFYLPIDHPLCVKLVIALLKPKAIIFIETELWPSLIHQVSCPCFLINGRLSSKSYQSYLRYKRWTTPMFKKLKGIWCVSETVKERFTQLGGTVLSVHPNLKYLSCKENNVPVTSNLPRLVCGSTHPVEDVALINQLPTFQEHIPGFELVIIPRHQSRARWLKKQFSHYKGLVIEDRYGYTLSWYAKARWAFIGGSLIKHGGQNPLEPLSMNVFTIIGPHFYNFTSIVNDLQQNQFITVINHEKDIVDILKHSTQSPECSAFFHEQKALAKKAIGDLERRISGF